MKNKSQLKVTGKFFFTFALLTIALSSNGQTNYVVINDTRNVIDSPTFFKQSLRVDFKLRNLTGAPGEGSYMGVLTVAPWKDNSGGKNHQLGFNNGGIFYRMGSHLLPTWESWRKLVIEDANGNVGIGTVTPTEKLSVKGKIRAQEVKVEMSNWPDYVFSEDYTLTTLAETEKHIKAHGHLPGIPSAAEVEKNGVEVGEMNKKLLQKIEELTLYLIEQNNNLAEQQKKLKDQNDLLISQKADLELLKEKVNSLEDKK